MILLWKDKEQHMLSLFKKGDTQAINKLYTEYADYLTGVCARYISDEESLKDVLQESFIKIFTKINQFEYRGEGSLKAWMTSIAVNEALSHLRSTKELNIPLYDSDLADFPDEEPDVEDIDTETLFSFIQQLPAGYRTVFNLFVMEEKSHKEIAEILHIKPSTSASQFLRAKKLLAEMIRDYKHQTENR
ncbi:MAG: RNA polymerase sigma factor [Bacteroidaceae bacterium]|nr:RNA polymerase sigma factor [Bacteroidaceae bacterium]